MIDLKYIQNKTGIIFDDKKAIGGQGYGYTSKCGSFSIGVVNRDDGNNHVVLYAKGFSLNLITRGKLNFPNDAVSQSFNSIMGLSA